MICLNCLKDVKMEEKIDGISACPECSTHFKNGKALCDADKALAEAREKLNKKRVIEQSCVEAEVVSGDYEQFGHCGT